VQLFGLQFTDVQMYLSRSSLELKLDHSIHDFRGSTREELVCSCRQTRIHCCAEPLSAVEHDTHARGCARKELKRSVRGYKEA
jgi:hypothetical protein